MHLGKDYEYIANFKDNDELRASFNELTEKTFDFNFMDFYENGFWGDNYIPCSIMDDGKIVANVSFNLMDFYVDGIKKRYIQLGTVMTDKEYRGQGLSRYLIERIIEEHKDKCDGMYLFANDDVTEFYPKFGFARGKECRCSKAVNFSGKERKIIKVNMEDKRLYGGLFEAVKHIYPNDRLTMDNYGLYGFWLAGPMHDMIYYCKEEDAYAVAGICDNILSLYQVIADHKVDIEKVIEYFGEGVESIVLGFTPIEDKTYEKKLYTPENTNFFILGEKLEYIEKNKLMFPLLSHA